MKILVSEEDIAKHYQNGVSVLQAYRKFEKTHNQATIEGCLKAEVAATIGTTSWALARWGNGTKPCCVKGVDFLKKRELVPLDHGSSTLGLVTFLAGLNWHSGTISMSENQPAFKPQFYLTEPFYLDQIAQMLDLELKYDSRHKRYTLPSQVTLLLTELGVPSEGRKSEYPFPHPRFVDDLAHIDRERMRLFLGTQVLTRSFPHRRNAMVVYLNGKKDAATAMDAGFQAYSLYRWAFSDMDIKPPMLNRNVDQGIYFASLRMPKTDHEKIISHVDERIRRELELVREHQASLKELQAS